MFKSEFSSSKRMVTAHTAVVIIYLLSVTMKREFVVEGRQIEVAPRHTNFMNSFARTLKYLPVLLLI